MDNSVFERMCHILDTFSTPSSVFNRKEPLFLQKTAFQQFARACNMQKYYYWPCKINGRTSGRRFQRFYYEKTLVGAWRGTVRYLRHTRTIVTHSMLGLPDFFLKATFSTTFFPCKLRKENFKKNPPSLIGQKHSRLV